MNLPISASDVQIIRGNLDQCERLTVLQLEVMKQNKMSELKKFCIDSTKRGWFLAWSKIQIDRGYGFPKTIMVPFFAFESQQDAMLFKLYHSGEIVDPKIIYER